MTGSAGQSGAAEQVGPADQPGMGSAAGARSAAGAAVGEGGPAGAGSVETASVDAAASAVGVASPGHQAQDPGGAQASSAAAGRSPAAEVSLSAIEPRRPRVVLGVGGGIAAYKACEVLRRLTETGHDVLVVPTDAALRFVGAATFEALSGHPVHTGVFADVPEVPHVRIGKQADLVLVVPATADVLARAAHGVADDLLTATLLTARCPVMFAPAMHTEMWEHPATRDNVTLLRSRGIVVTEPASGRLTGVDTGKGRLADPAEIVDLARLLLAAPGALPHDLAGVRVVVSAGGTREPLDPVRYLGNRSSGKQGYALATVAAARGADVTLVAAHTQTLPEPAGATLVRVGTAAELRDAMHKATQGADVVVMAAAVADFRPLNRADHKIKKTDHDPEPVALTRNADILAELVAARAPGQVIVGFAAETGDSHGDVLEHARAKLKRKGADLLVVNPVGEGQAFEVEDNSGWLLAANGTESPLPLGAKSQLAARVWDSVRSLLPH